jgi:hypothetical protein
MGHAHIFVASVDLGSRRPKLFRLAPTAAPQAAAGGRRRPQFATVFNRLVAAPQNGDRTHLQNWQATAPGPLVLRTELTESDLIYASPRRGRPGVKP